MRLSLNELLSSDALTSLFITLWAQLMGAPIYAKALSRATKKAIKNEFDIMINSAKHGGDSYDIDINEVVDRVWNNIEWEERELLGDEYNAQDKLYEAFKTVRNIIWCYEARTMIDTDTIW